MAWCENPECMKQNLRKEDLSFDPGQRQLVCRECFLTRYPGATPIEVVDYTAPPPSFGPPGLQYEVTINNREGFKARVSYGDLSFGFHAPIAALQKWLT